MLAVFEETTRLEVLALFTVGLVAGLSAAWLLWQIVPGGRRSQNETIGRLRAADRRLSSVMSERDDARAEVLTLRSAYRNEADLLDGVATRTGVEPDTFRRIVAREYLGRDLTNDTPSFGHDDVHRLQAELEARDRQLESAVAEIQEIRAAVEVLAGSTLVSAPAEVSIDLRRSETVIDLCERRGVDPEQLARAEAEVRELRARLADLSVANDDLGTRLERRRRLDDRLRLVIDELSSLQSAVADESVR